MGYDAGDGEWFENVPGSGTASIINITRTSNVGVNGVWTFQLNAAESICALGIKVGRMLTNIACVMLSLQVELYKSSGGEQKQYYLFLQ